MRVLLHTRFYPSVGGLETVAALLADEWVRAGHSVTVATDVQPDREHEVDFAFPVVHQPSLRDWLRLLRTHDLFVHFNISLRALWPMLFVRRPFVAVHHGYYIIDRTGRRDWREKLKLWVARRATKNIAVSEAVARAIRVPCTVIPNPYDATIFFPGSDSPRPHELIFVGRLVSDKGLDVLLTALASLRDTETAAPRLTIVGDGPERARLTKLAQQLRVEEQVTFTGAKTQTEVANILRTHAIVVIPSLVAEGFGLVALEAIASGCVVIGSDTGGLPEAIGPCGLTFPAGDPVALAHRIKELLTDEGRISELKMHSTDHLERHRPACVGAKYLEIMKKALCAN